MLGRLPFFVSVSFTLFAFTNLGSCYCCCCCCFFSCVFSSLGLGLTFSTCIAPIVESLGLPFCLCFYLSVCLCLSLSLCLFLCLCLSCSLIAVFTAEWNHQPCDLMKEMKRRSRYYGIVETLISCSTVCLCLPCISLQFLWQNGPSTL
jgi:hypothetical protein